MPHEARSLLAGFVWPLSVRWLDESIVDARSARACGTCPRDAPARRPWRWVTAFFFALPSCAPRCCSACRRVVLCSAFGTWLAAQRSFLPRLLGPLERRKMRSVCPCVVTGRCVDRRTCVAALRGVDQRRSNRAARAALFFDSTISSNTHIDAQSGIDCTDESVEAFNELKLKHTYRYVIYAMNGAHRLFSRAASTATLTSPLQTRTPRSACSRRATRTPSTRTSLPSCPRTSAATVRVFVCCVVAACADCM